MRKNAEIMQKLSGLFFNERNCGPRTIWNKSDVLRYQKIEINLPFFQKIICEHKKMWACNTPMLIRGFCGALGFSDLWLTEKWPRKQRKNDTRDNTECLDMVKKQSGRRGVCVRGWAWGEIGRGALGWLVGDCGYGVDMGEASTLWNYRWNQIWLKYWY